MAAVRPHVEDSACMFHATMHRWSSCNRSREVQEPQYMPVPVPMRGHQGLWYLDQREYHTARARLRPAPQVATELSCFVWFITLASHMQHT